MKVCGNDTGNERVGHTWGETICITDGKDQVPLLEKRPVSRKDRVACVVDARCFRGRTVEFDDLEIFSGAKIIFAGEPDVVATDEKPGELL